MLLLLYEIIHGNVTAARAASPFHGTAMDKAMLDWPARSASFESFFVMAVTTSETTGEDVTTPWFRTETGPVLATTESRVATRYASGNVTRRFKGGCKSFLSDQSDVKSTRACT